jgi:hypothetical protein
MANQEVSVFTQEQHEAIARIIRNTETPSQLSNGALAVYYDDRRDVARAFGEMLARDNPWFDRVLFFDAACSGINGSSHRRGTRDLQPFPRDDESHAAKHGDALVG